MLLIGHSGEETDAGATHRFPRDNLLLPLALRSLDPRASRDRRIAPSWAQFAKEQAPINAVHHPTHPSLQVSLQSLLPFFLGIGFEFVEISSPAEGGAAALTEAKRHTLVVHPKRLPVVDL